MSQSESLVTRIFLQAVQFAAQCLRYIALGRKIRELLLAFSFQIIKQTYTSSQERSNKLYIEKAHIFVTLMSCGERSAFCAGWPMALVARTVAQLGVRRFFCGQQ